MSDLPPPRWINAAIYARVSKPRKKKKKAAATDAPGDESGEEEEDEYIEGQTVEQQIDVLTRWATPQAEWVCVISEGVSSRKRRVKLEWLLERLRAGDFDVIVVWKLDRIARNAQEMLGWRDEVDKHGFNIISYTEAIDLHTPPGRLMFTIMAAVNEYERDIISMRTKAKLDYLREHEKRVPGKNSRIYDPVQAAKLHGRLSVRKLAAALGVSRGTASRLKTRLGDAEEKASGEGARTARMRSARGTILASGIAAEVSHTGDVDAFGVKRTP